jgi:adenine-specific DNA-methyltransferase
MSSDVTARQRKETGAHFTPRALAQLIAEKIVGSCDLTRSKLRVLDPSCGDGELLQAFYEAVPAKKRRGLTLIGMDQDASSIADAKKRLGILKCDVHLEQGDFLETALAFSTQASLWRSAASSYSDVDVVIANPPYVRTQVLGASKAQELASLFGLTGRVDLYHAFLAAMTAALKTDGILGVITSNRYLSTRGGASTRSFLAEQFEILELVDLGDTKLFEAAVLPALFFGRRRHGANGNAQMAKFVRIYEAASLSGAGVATKKADTIVDAVRSGETGTYSIAGKSYALSSGEIAIGRDGGQTWSMATTREACWIDAIDAAAIGRFGDVAKIRVGIKTTADSVFIRSDWTELDSEIRPEPEVLKPLISQDTALRWAHPAAPERRVLYTHEVVAGRRAPIDFEKRYPRAWAYLLSHRDRLEGRSYVTAAGRAWYEIWVPQDPRAWAEPKLVFPDISPAPKFLFDPDGYLVDGNCYWATLSEGQSENILFLMLALSNSAFMTRYHDVAFQNMLYSGRRRYLTQYVEKYPVPDPSTPAAIELVARARLRTEAVRAGALTFVSDADDDLLIAEAFGVEISS